MKLKVHEVIFPRINKLIQGKIFQMIIKNSFLNTAQINVMILERKPPWTSLDMLPFLMVRF